DQSLAVATKARDAARAANDIRGEAEALNYMAYAHRAQSLLALSRTEALESVRLYKQAGDRWGEAQGYNTLGLIEADDGRFADALEHHLRALAIREADGDKEGLSYTFNNLGNIYRNMGEFEKALDHHERGLKLKIELGNKSSEAYSHQNMGLVYFAMKDNAKALAAYQRALAIREQLGDTRAQAVSLNAIGSVEVLSDPAAALRTYERALELRRKNQDLRGEMATELNIADVYRRMGRLGPAAAAIERVMALGARIDAPLLRSNALKALSEIDALRGDFAAAYKHVLEYQAARDAIFNQETAERFHHLEAAQDAERQQQQIQLLERENALRESELRSVRTSRMMLTVIAGLVIVSLVLLYARHRLKHESVLLRGLLPICAWCKKIRDDKGYWTQVESYITSHSAAEFTHCICPSCGDRVTEEARNS
ncbi:MAG TPA: tetratricopeptide repeat protein, partial [Vicinamibacterales bacterium]|nr:tetratricopeptide repeat protein [Vicinamibacterales bacterium]